MKWKYTIYIDTMDGRRFEDKIITDARIDNKDELVTRLVSTPFIHIVNGNTISIINLANVSHIVVTETQIQF